MRFRFHAKLETIKDRFSCKVAIHSSSPGPFINLQLALSFVIYNTLGRPTFFCEQPSLQSVVVVPGGNLTVFFSWCCLSHHDLQIESVLAMFCRIKLKEWEGMGEVGNWRL